LFYDDCNILHMNAALSSTDAANCYDAVNHPVCSIALQSMSVPLTAVKTYLRCLQTMHFYLKTGFGLSSTSHGGTPALPYMGLTQGSSASPPVWTAVSTLIVNAYRRAGHGMCLSAGWTPSSEDMAAILYVDDTDLLHLCTDRDTSDTEFVTEVGEATYLWAQLLRATGGNLKFAKCFYYLMLWTFKNGIPKLATRKDLLHLPPIMIPQSDQTDVAIHLKDPSEASETLGVYTSPTGAMPAQLEKLVKRAADWVARVRSSHLSHREVWQSLRTQLIPSLRYSLVPLMTSPAELEGIFLDWQYTALPHLGINRNITTDWRWLPWEFQGLGLPNLGIMKGADMVQYLVRHWGSKHGLGHRLRRSYELTQLDCGLEGNFLVRDFDALGNLATPCWMTTLWEYTWYYRATLTLEEITVPTVRERDRVFMELVIASWPPQDWARINRVRQHKNIYFLSQLLASDGSNVSPINLDQSPGPRSTMLFPRQAPTPADFKLWKRVLHHIISPKLRWSPPLGKYLRQPYEAEIWWTGELADSIFCTDAATGTTTKYTREDTAGRTRRSVAYFPSPTPVWHEAPRCYVTVHRGTHGRLILHSTGSIKSRPGDNADARGGLARQISDLGREDLLRTLNIGEDDDWITAALFRGSLITCHDGSYMPDLEPAVCSAALVFVCTHTGRMGTWTTAEKTTALTASNYRGEGIGAILNGLLLWAGSRALPASLPTVVTGCDNMGIICQARNCSSSLPEKQPQADVIRCLRNVLSRLPCLVQYQHVLGHQDEGAPFTSLPLLAQMNIIADGLAKKSLEEAVATASYASSTWPFEGVRIYIQGNKVTASVQASLEHSWGERVARRLFLTRRITDARGFDMIDFDIMKQAMSKLPQGFRTWVTKQVSHFSGTNRMLRRQDDTTDRCPCCGKVEETSAHITTCPDPGRTKMFNESVVKLGEWLEETSMDDTLALGIIDYLLARGTKTLSELLPPDKTLQEYAADHDHLGWSNFLEGRIARSLTALQQGYILQGNCRMNIRTWATTLIHHLLGITHRQWIYRNAKVHLKTIEGRTHDEHFAILQEVRQFLQVDPEGLLPCHQALLQEDCRLLGEGSTTYRIQWLDGMESALAAWEHTHSAALQAGHELAGDKGIPARPPPAPPGQRGRKDRRYNTRRSRHSGIQQIKRSNLSKTDHGPGNTHGQEGQKSNLV
jgi:hypothetical protein